MWNHTAVDTLLTANYKETMWTHCGQPPDYTLQNKNVKTRCCEHLHDYTKQDNNVNLHCCGHPPDYTLHGHNLNPQCCGHPPVHTLLWTPSWLHTTRQQFETTQLWTPFWSHTTMQQCEPTLLWTSSWLHTTMQQYELTLLWTPSRPPTRRQHCESKAVWIHNFAPQTVLGTFSLLIKPLSILPCFLCPFLLFWYPAEPHWSAKFEDQRWRTLRSPYLWRCFTDQGVPDVSTDPTAFISTVTQYSNNEYSISQDVICLLELLHMSHIMSWLRLIHVSIMWFSNGILIWNKKWTYCHSKLECAEIRPVSALHKTILDAFPHLACCVLKFVVV
jgi:hypothetical protein